MMLCNEKHSVRVYVSLFSSGNLASQISDEEHRCQAKLITMSCYIALSTYGATTEAGEGREVRHAQNIRAKQPRVAFQSSGFSYSMQVLTLFCPPDTVSTASGTALQHLSLGTDCTTAGEKKAVCVRHTVESKKHTASKHKKEGMKYL